MGDWKLGEGACVGRSYGGRRKKGEIREKEEAWVGGWDWVGGMWGITGYLMNEIKLAFLVYAVYLVFW